MESVERLILKAALSPSMEAAEGWLTYKNSVNQSDMPNILNWCGGYIYKNLKTLGIKDDYLKGIYKHNWTSNTYRLQRLNNVLSEISKVAVITPIKSFGLNSKHFNLGLRSIGDFDFFFDVSSFNSIVKILGEHNFELFMGVSTDELKDKIFSSRGSWSYKNGPIDDLDLHWKIFDELSVEQNLRLVIENSEMKRSNWGEYREMSNELSAVTISHHQYLQGGLNFSALCDLKQILEVSDTNRVFEIANEIGMSEVLKCQIENITEIIDGRELSLPIISSNSNPKNINKYENFIQNATLKYPLLYRIWLKLGAKSKIEHTLIRIFGIFSNPNSYMKNAQTSIVMSDNLNLGSGWHYRYPGNDFQWTTYPDTRIILRSSLSKKMTLEIELDPHHWSLSIPQRIDCFMNGKFIGNFGKENNCVKFEVEARNGLNEISFRSPKPWEMDLTGIGYNWRRLQMPVRLIKVNG